MLYVLTQDELARTCASLRRHVAQARGVRALAERARPLQTPDKRDSQDICFVPDGDYAGVMELTHRPKGEARPAILSVPGAAR